jgi:hypothetical protein
MYLLKLYVSLRFVNANKNLPTQIVHKGSRRISEIIELISRFIRTACIGRSPHRLATYHVAKSATSTRELLCSLRRMSFSTESDQRLTHREHINPMAADIDLSPTAHTPICTDFEETPVENDRQCRICYGDDGDPTLGRLFSPCKCKGTMRYVHVECLRRWREMSVNKESTYR